MLALPASESCQLAISSACAQTDALSKKHEFGGGVGAGAGDGKEEVGDWTASPRSLVANGERGSDSLIASALRQVVWRQWQQQQKLHWWSNNSGMVAWWQ